MRAFPMGHIEVIWFKVHMEQQIVCPQMLIL